MISAETDARLEAVRKAVASVPNGATLIDVAVQLSPPAAQRNIQRWLGMLVEQNKIVRIGSARQSRYRLRDGADAQTAPAVSLVGQAIWRLVNQPLAERMPSDYHRMWLDSYRPNQTYFIPEPARRRLRTPTVVPAGIGAASTWRDPAVFNRIAADLAWQSGWIEAQNSAQPSAACSLADVAAWLAQPESLNPRREVQLLWNQQAALCVLLERAPNVTLSYDVLTAVYAPLTRKLARRCRPSVATSVSGGVETCFNQILGWAPVIADPIEQAFFVFVHLLYLQPFGMLNASMACLAVNIPLLRAGLPPITFAGVRGADLLDGLRGVWEINRTELLRDVFVAAWSGRRPCLPD